MIPRPFQNEAVSSIFLSWEQYLRILLVLPTGTGKTIVFSIVTAKSVQDGHRVLILAHRDELIRQAVAKLRTATGMSAAIEKGKETSIDSWLPITVGSVQTMCRQKRLDTFAHDQFTRIIVDECHHILSPTYQRVLSHFPQAQVLGVTATPDRGDKRSLGQFFETIAYQYPIRQAISEKYLCPILAETIPLKIDLTHVNTTKGDYDTKDLSVALEPFLIQIADEMKKRIGNRKTLVFLPLIATSIRFVEILRERGIKANHISGESQDREQILKAYHHDEFQVLCNSMLLTEGYDQQDIGCIVCLRPTKVRGLFAQIIGRGTRIWPGKDNLLVLDFLWLSAKHDLCHVSSLIAEDPEVAEKMDEIQDEQTVTGGPIDLEQLEEKAIAAVNTQREESLAKKLKENQRKKGRTIDPIWFAVEVAHAPELATYQPRELWEFQAPTAAQIELLSKFGFKEESIPNKGFAAQLTNKVMERRQAGLASGRQLKILAQYDLPHSPNLTSEQASGMIAQIEKNIWRKNIC